MTVHLTRVDSITKMTSVIAIQSCEKKLISNEITRQQQHIDNLIRAFHLVGIYETPRMIHAEYALKTLESKNLIFKAFGSEAEKIIQRLVIETYMGNSYRELELP